MIVTIMINHTIKIEPSTSKVVEVEKLREKTNHLKRRKETQIKWSKWKEQNKIEYICPNRFVITRRIMD